MNDMFIITQHVRIGRFWIWTFLFYDNNNLTAIYFFHGLTVFPTEK